jgi:hypothetical protein
VRRYACLSAHRFYVRANIVAKFAGTVSEAGIQDESRVNPPSNAETLASFPPPCLG